jgi:hypothetical protein
MTDHKFDLWLEFEQWLPTESEAPEDDYFNMQITLPNGTKYALNVWTFKAIGRIAKEHQETGACLQGSYLLPPDLFVERLDRELLERIVADLIAQGGLKDEWEIPDSGEDF